VNNIFQLRSYPTIISKAFTYCCHVGVLKNFQKGIFSSSTGTFLKNVINASMNFCVSAFASSSKQPKRTSNAIRAIAVSNNKTYLSNSFVYIRKFMQIYLLHSTNLFVIKIIVSFGKFIVIFFI